jgi:heat shock protein HslJ
LLLTVFLKTIPSILSLVLLAISQNTATTSGGIQLIGSSWQFLALNGRYLLSGGLPITVNFDNNVIFGSDGCNSFSGEYHYGNNQLNHKRKSFETTAVDCGNTVNEQAFEYRIALKKIHFYHINGKRLVLSNQQKKIVLTYQFTDYFYFGH